jgi:hypothetical protein
MASNRRAFLQFAGLAPAAAATASLASTGASPAAAGGPVNRSSFLACVGDEFHFESGPFESKPAKLARVVPLEVGRRKVESEGKFRLEFEPRTPGTIAQDTYAVNHARLGRIVIFVSPNDAEGRVVEAVFNSL